MIGKHSVKGDISMARCEMGELSEHVQHSLRKFAVAVAFWVIKRKPKTVTTLEFCKQIQNKLKRSEESIENIDLDSYASELLDDVFDRKSEEGNETELDPTIVKSSTKTNLRLIHAIGEIKNTVYCVTDERVTTQTSQLDTQESGYASLIPSQKSVNEGYNVEKKMSKLDDSLNIIIDFLIEMSREKCQDDLFSKIAEFLGQTIDILYQQNIYTPSIDRLSDVIEKTIQEILNDCNNMDDVWSGKLRLFSALDRPIIFIKRSLKILSKYLEEFLNKLQQSADNAIECEDPDYLNKLYFIFQLIEELLMIYNKKIESIDKVETPKEQTDKISNVLSPNWNLPDMKMDNRHAFEKCEDNLISILNRLAFDCVESYPLVSFQAMECIKIRKDDRRHSNSV